VESLMPLRLARYGVPLAETAPSGLAAAGIEPALLPAPAAKQDPAVEEADSPTSEARALSHGQQPVRASLQTQSARQDRQGTNDQPHHQAETATAPANPLHADFGISATAGNPLSKDELQPLPRPTEQPYTSPTGARPAPGAAQGTSPDESRDEFIDRAWITDLPDVVTALYERKLHNGQMQKDDTDHGVGEQTPAAPATVETDRHPTLTVGTHSAEGKEGLQMNAAVTDDETPPSPCRENNTLTVVDHYYLAWLEHQKQHGTEPSDKQLSGSLAGNGVKGRGGKPVSPSTLRRYLLPFRIYTVWASHRTRDEIPSASAVAQDCTTRGITAQYKNPLTANDITKQAHDFERRWKTLTRRNSVT
ncbi:hypothetical protein ABT031_43020, partial [Streptomyces sp. NPDC096934]